MARAKAKNGADGSHPVDDNERKADDADKALFYFHKRRYRSFLAKKKEADADFKNACKLARGDLGEDIVEEIKTSISWEKKGGEAMVRKAMAQLARLARWSGFSIGSQAELFRDVAPQETPTAFDRGFIAGMDGLDPSPPFDPGSPDASEWMSGWHEGSAKVNEIIRAKDAEEFAAADEAGAGDEDDGEGDGAPLPIGDQDATSQLRT